MQIKAHLSFSILKIFSFSVLDFLFPVFCFLCSWFCFSLSVLYFLLRCLISLSFRGLIFFIFWLPFSLLRSTLSSFYHISCSLFPTFYLPFSFNYTLLPIRSLFSCSPFWCHLDVTSTTHVLLQFPLTHFLWCVMSAMMECCCGGVNNFFSRVLLFLPCCFLIFVLFILQQ